MTPMELFEQMCERAMTMAQASFIESGRDWPADEGTVEFIRTMLGIGVAAACEHLAKHPEHLAMAASPICETCREPIQTLQVGVDPSDDPNNPSEVAKVAWPCGHRQP